MSMTLRERALAVYRGETPDVVPWFADLSHWVLANSGEKWEFNPSGGQPFNPHELELHRRVGAGIYLNLGQFHDVTFTDGVQESAWIEHAPDGDVSHWKLETPIGAVEELRAFEPISYSWNIRKRMLDTLQDLRVFRYAMERRQFIPRYERYAAAEAACGEIGLPYAPMSYSGFGYLISRCMGIEKTIYAATDLPEEVGRLVDAVNETNLQLVDLLAASPAHVVLFSDNFSSDVQSPRVVARWSARYFREAFRRLHQAGKRAAVHIDGRLRGLLRTFADLGADCADAVTPAPMGDLAPGQCRDEAGPGLILWGGVSPALWSRTSPDEPFRQAVLNWLELRRRSPRLVMAPGDQVPPDADLYRIEMVRELVEEYGRYQ